MTSSMPPNSFAGRQEGFVEESRGVRLTRFLIMNDKNDLQWKKQRHTSVKSDSFVQAGAARDTKLKEHSLDGQLFQDWKKTCCFMAPFHVVVDGRTSVSLLW